MYSDIKIDPYLQKSRAKKRRLMTMMRLLTTMTLMLWKICWVLFMFTTRGTPSQPPTQSGGGMSNHGGGGGGGRSKTGGAHNSMSQWAASRKSKSMSSIMCVCRWGRLGTD